MSPVCSACSVASLGHKYATAAAVARLKEKVQEKVNFPWTFSFSLLSLSLATYEPRVGATCQIRTDDLRFTKPLLYQLS